MVAVPRNRASLRGLGLVLAAALVAAPSARQQTQTTSSSSAAAQQGQTPDQQATFRARIDSVMVDVSVTDKQGKPVTDLTAADFEIKENNKPQTVETFKYVGIDDTPIDASTVPEIVSMSDQERETAQDDRRIIVIFLDDYHTHLTASMRIRGQLAAFVRSLNPRDLVAIVTPLMPVSLITFSHDLEGIANQIMSFQGRKYDYTPKYPVESSAQFLDPRTIEQTRNTVVISELQAVCAYLGTLRDGRKSLLYVSEGLTGDVQNATIMGGSSSTIGTGGLNSQALQQEFLDIFQAASRSNTAIYTMDPRGMAAMAIEPGDPGGGTTSMTLDRQLLTTETDALREIADNTGGRAILVNEPKDMLKQMLRDSSAYYLLGYTSTERYRDGKFHPISVKVNRKDVEIRARKGYYAYSADEVAKATAPPKPRPPAAVTNALDSVEEPGRDHPFRVWAAATKGADGKPQVTMSWEFAADAPAGSKSAPIDHVTLNARSVTGDTVFDGDVKANPAASVPSGSVAFSVPPGGVRLKATAVAASGERIDTIDRDVDVPDFTSVGAFITTPAVFSAHTAREMNKIRSAPVSMPTPIRQFARTEQLLFRFQAYGPGGTTPKVTMRLLNEGGQTMVELPAPTAVGNGSFEAIVGLGALVAADYVFEIDADSGNGTKAQALVAVKITG